MYCNFKTELHLEHANLAKGELSHVNVVHGLEELFYGHDLTGLLVSALHDYAVATLAYDFDVLVFVHFFLNLRHWIFRFGRVYLRLCGPNSL